MSQPFLGEIRMFGFHFAPSQWAFCDGRLLIISQNTALFTLIGTTFGGDGRTTFALPNLQNAAPMHWGNGVGLTPRVLGEALGEQGVTLTISQMPQHNHMVQSAQAAAAVQETGTPDATAYVGNSNPGSAYSSTTSALNAQFSPKAIGVNGGGGPHPNVQPVLALNACIALVGIFPSRN